MYKIYAARIIELLFTVYNIMLLTRVLGTWFPSFSQGKFMAFLRHYTDPYLNLFRKIIPPLGVLDLSPMVAFFALQILERIVLWILL